MIVGHENDSVSGSDAEDANQTDERRDTHDPAGQEDRYYSTDQCERKVCHNQKGSASRIECFVKKEKDHHDGNGPVRQESARCLLLAFELATILDKIPRR